MIPSSVTNISSRAFSYCIGLQKFIVPAEVNTTYKAIDGILYGILPNEERIELELVCMPSGKSLETYKMPEEVTSIGDFAFFEYAGLTNIEIPFSVTNIGDAAFFGCSGLTNVTMMEGVTSIGNMAFSYCRKLQDVKIPSSVTSIGDMAFSYCDSLTQIEIPASVTKIGWNVFLNTNCYIITSEGSAAADYAEENGIDVEIRVTDSAE